MFFLAIALSSFYLFTLNGGEFLGSSILFYVLTFFSISITCAFFYFYSFAYRPMIIHQLKEVQKKKSTTWFGWFSDNLNELASMFLFTTPYLIVFVSLIRGIVYLLPGLAILNILSVVVMAVFCMVMVFMLISHLFNISYTKKKNFEF